MIGDVAQGNDTGFVDILAANGHMRWLQPNRETLPCAWRDWLNALADFVLVFPFGDVLRLLDEERESRICIPWVACRQCRRKEKTPLAQSSFYKASKLTDKWSEDIILENTHTGGYPSADPDKYAAVNPTFPMFDLNWRDTAMRCDAVDLFFAAGTHDFCREAVERTSEHGDDLIKRYGSLHMALRAAQEPKMQEQHVLCCNAKEHLSQNVELQNDIVELHEIGAIPKYRGNTPGTFRVRGFPHNPSEELYIMDKLWGYVKQGKMFVCTSSEIAPGDLFMASPSTTVPKKLPDRTVSTDRRAIWDWRRLNLKRPKGDYWAVITPTIEELARRYCYIKTSNPWRTDGRHEAGHRRCVYQMPCPPRLRGHIWYGVHPHRCAQQPGVFLPGITLRVYRIARHFLSDHGRCTALPSVTHTGVPGTKRRCPIIGPRLYRRRNVYGTAIGPTS